MHACAPRGGLTHTNTCHCAGDLCRTFFGKKVGFGKPANSLADPARMIATMQPESLGVSGSSPLDPQSSDSALLPKCRGKKGIISGKNYFLVMNRRKSAYT